MKLNAALSFFNSLIIETYSKPEIKVYQSFIGIISDLENRDFEDEELQDIEKSLAMLELDSDPNNRKRYYRKSMKEFKKYLKEEFSLVTEGYYTEFGIALGLAFGVATGSAIGIGPGIALGMLIGLEIGTSKVSEAKKQNRVLEMS